MVTARQGVAYVEGQPGRIDSGGSLSGPQMSSLLTLAGLPQQQNQGGVRRPLLPSEGNNDLLVTGC